MSVQHGTMARVTPSQVTPSPSALAHRADEHNREAQASLGEGAGLGGSALARAVERWRRALLHDQAAVPGFAGSPTGGLTPGPTAATSSAIPPADTERGSRRSRGGWTIAAAPMGGSAQPAWMQ